MRAVLAIGGSDSSGGAGIQADLRTLAAFGLYGATAVTAITAQGLRGVRGVWPAPPAAVAAQVRAVLEELPVAAVKIGMLATDEIAGLVLAELERRPELPIVLDPVLAASDGTPLSAEGPALARLLQRAALVTPNLPEAARLLGASEESVRADPEGAARRLRARGARAVLVKGGHAGGASSLDTLVDAAGAVHYFAGPRIATANTHGTGCVLASAIAALLALGLELPRAVGRARAFQEAALRAGAALDWGPGNGPLWPLPEGSAG